MEKTIRVINSEGNTTGFVIDGHYEEYYTVLKNIEWEPQLMINESGEIVSKETELPTMSVKEVYQAEYEQVCRERFLQRDIASDFAEWRERYSDKVLYLRGARQTGKTTELMKFAYHNYEQIIYINLALDADSDAFTDCVVGNTSLRYGMKAYCKERGLATFSDNSNTIIIIDEIQEDPVVYNMIRALNHELGCHIAVTGSYLGRTLNAEFFKPAGNLHMLELLPLSFYEFCRAFGQEEVLMQIDIYGGDDRQKYETLTELYRVYRQIGGYPDIVSSYIVSKDMKECLIKLEDLLAVFTDESKRYFENDKCEVIFQNVYKMALMQIANEKKGTGAKDIDIITGWIKDSAKEHVSRNEVAGAISWLEYSGILDACDLYNNGNVNDLLPNRRMYFKDCGLANCIALRTSLSQQAIEGMLTETFAYTELYRLCKKRIVKTERPCFSTYNNYELDFMLITQEDEVYGLEVKTTNSSNPISLNVYLDKGFIDEGYMAGVTRGGIRERIKTIPIYTIGVRFPYK